MISQRDLDACGRDCICDQAPYTQFNVITGIAVVTDAKEKGCEVFVEDEFLIFKEADGTKHRKACPCKGCLELFRLVVQEVYGVN